MSSPQPASASAPAPNHRSYWPYLVVSVFWILIGLLFASQMLVTENMGWRRAFGRAGADWLPWVVLSPGIFWLAMRFPFARGHVIRASALSLVVCVASVFLAEKVFSYIRPILTGEAAAPLTAGDLPPDGPAGGARRGPPQGYPGWNGDDGPPGPPAPGFGPRGRRLGGPGAGPGGALGPMQHMMHFHLPMALFVIMASNAYAYFLQMRERERKANELARSLAEARLSALQMQLHPHFLFNALNATTALIRRNPDAAEEMIANLSELLRLALSVRDRHEVSVAQELGYLECYLAIERVRFGDRLQVHWEVDETVKEARVPVLLLQPILENAIRHGIERRNVDIGQVWITAARNNGRLFFSIRDNGPGPKVTTNVKRGHGVGLDNTRARLAALHGANAEARMETGAGGGCVVTIEMPFQSQSEILHENQSSHR